MRRGTFENGVLAPLVGVLPMAPLVGTCAWLLLGGKAVGSFQAVAPFTRTLLLKSPKQDGSFERVAPLVRLSAWLLLEVGSFHTLAPFLRLLAWLLLDGGSS